MTMDETFDVGVDTRTGVDDRDYKLPFRFNGKLNKVTFNLGPEVLTRVRPQGDAPKHHQSKRLDGVVWLARSEVGPVRSCRPARLWRRETSTM